MKLSSVLRYIEKETGAVASIHILHPAFLDCEALRLEPDQSLHHGEFCRYNKMHGEIKTCINNKARSLNVASRGRSFAGTCPFGIWDYVRPVLFEGKLIAVLYLGGFRKDLPLPSAWKGPLPGIVTEKEKKELRQYADFMERFIRIEIGIWSRTGGSKGKQRTPEYYVRNSMFFIDCNFSKDISVEDAAETLRVTPNYLGEQIRKHTGKSFRLILNERRKKDPSTPTILLDEYAPIANASGNAPPLILIAGDTTVEWPARAEENLLLEARLRRNFGDRNVRCVLLPTFNHGTMVTPGLAVVNNYILDALKRTAAPKKGN